MPSLWARRRHAATSSCSQYGIRSSWPCDGIVDGAAIPAQVIVSSRSAARIETALMFQEPEIPVFLVHDIGCRLVAAPAGGDAPLDSGDRRRAAASMRTALRELRSRGIETVSAIGGRTTARALLHEGLVHDCI